MKNFTLDGRLSSVREFVRQGARFADIGTDHAYLPISLLEEGIISFALCSDVNRGPLDSAVANVCDHGLSDKCAFALADGLSAADGLGITDIAICGMGGELIASIINAKDFVKDPGIRLILQPMTRPGQLRRYLWSSGFQIIGESYSTSQGRYYVTIAAEYSGAAAIKNEIEYEIGEEKYLWPLTSIKASYLASRLSAFVKSFDGKKMGGQDTSSEEEIIAYIRKILETGCKK